MRSIKFSEESTRLFRQARANLKRAGSQILMVLKNVLYLLSKGNFVEAKHFVDKYSSLAVIPLKIAAYVLFVELPLLYGSAIIKVMSQALNHTKDLIQNYFKKASVLVTHGVSYVSEFLSRIQKANILEKVVNLFVGVAKNEEQNVNFTAAEQQTSEENAISNQADDINHQLIASSSEEEGSIDSEQRPSIVSIDQPEQEEIVKNIPLSDILRTEQVPQRGLMTKMYDGFVNVLFSFYDTNVNFDVDEKDRNERYSKNKFSF